MIKTKPMAAMTIGELEALEEDLRDLLTLALKELGRRYRALPDTDCPAERVERVKKELRLLADSASG
jgi:hypothetical protein